jgi:PBP1b-binding outer membrane lipoprotein LpoB
MKKVIAFVALAAFISACSQYTCPTYSKKEAPKKPAAQSEQKI